MTNLNTVNYIEKTKINKKDAGNSHIKKKLSIITVNVKFEFLNICTKLFRFTGLEFTFYSSTKSV